ncbi:Uncharacterised protein [Mycobacteroides abscessus subsp. abscessus]|nr:Uncharacterised protein [Mycobacteroides abscessus subsp. abscessus]SKV19826.1 Uncharacterised protein [Mycobacteroides abscessus subsp. abscessus]
MRLEAIAKMGWLVCPGLMTLMTLAMPLRPGSATCETACFTEFCTSGSRVVRMRYPPFITWSLLMPDLAR